ncbi:hypothetical protein [Streptomyces sp. NPDC101166]|uniref:hypothetical protein n=1 Tax=Streptomyces sp. NPDC101166 TaxID=3366120 RepID=UPI003807FEBF
MQCCVCHRDLYADEQATCRPCTDRVDHTLQTIAGPDGLYARLSASLRPGSSTGGPVVSGSRTAPLPVRIEVLDLMTERGPIISALEGWVRDWEFYGRATVDEGGTLQRRVDHAVQTLRFNLAWAAAHHPAFSDFADEIHHVKRRAETATGAEKPPIKVPVTCRCGATVRFTLDTRSEICRACGAEYGHSELTRLPYAGRRAA